MLAIDRLKEYRDNRETYLPMIDHEKRFFSDRTEFEDINIGWDCGFFGERPYFLECWATSGITMMTIFLSTIGLEAYTVADIERMLINEGHIFTPKEGYESPSMIPVVVDDNKNSFFSVNIVVGLEDEPSRIDGGGHLMPFAALNSYNAMTGESIICEDDAESESNEVTPVERH